MLEQFIRISYTFDTIITVLYFADISSLGLKQTTNFNLYFCTYTIYLLVHASYFTLY